MTYLIHVTICWIAFYALYLALFSRATFFVPNRLYLMVSLLLGLMIPLTPELALEVAPDAAVAVYYLQPITVGVEQVAVAVSPTSNATAPISWASVLWWIYLGGMIISGGRFVYGLFKIGRLYARSERHKQSDYQLVLTRAAHRPFSFFRGLFWSNQFNCSEADRRKIIRHEEAHIRGWHSLDIMLIEILKILFWFSPPVYMYSRAIRAVHEYLADEAVLKTGYKKKQYGHLLIRQSVSGSQIALANHFFHSQLKKRIIMMTKTKSRKQFMGRYLLMLPLVACLALAFAMPDMPATKNPLSLSPNTVEGLPIFAGCEEFQNEQEMQECSKKALTAFMIKHLKYPETAKSANKEGIVYIEFTVNARGAIENPTVVKSAGYGMDEAALKVIEAMPRWTPAQKEGKAVATKMTLPFSFVLPDEKAGEVYKVVDEMPRFPGCEDTEDAMEREQCAKKALMMYIYSNIRYPEEAQKSNIEGTVVAQYTVSKEGQLKNIRIVRKVHPSVDAEVLRVVESMNEMEEAWIPGRHDGNVVNVEFNLPVKFKLEGKDQSKAQEASGEDQIYKVVEEMPHFPGCEHLEDSAARKQCSKKQLMEFMIQHLEYPESAKMAGSEGTVVIGFVVGKTGEIESVEVVKSVDPALDSEARRVVGLMKEKGLVWVPGYQAGKAVKVAVNLPLSFRLPKIENDRGAVQALELQNYQLSPNPTGGNVLLRFRGNEQPLTIRIFDNNGRELLVDDLPDFDGSFEQAYDLSKAPKGTLILQIRQGEKVFTDKLVLQ
jgi:TonB family protein